VRYVSSREIAEDIVSDVFYQFHSEETFRKVETSFRAYLFTSVRYRAFDYVRAEMRRSTSLQQAEYMPIGEDQQPDNLTQFEDLYHDVLRAIHDLPVKRRENIHEASVRGEEVPGNSKRNGFVAKNCGDAHVSGHSSGT
jgi:DNA-directed RNA polymerase specialized sigma24 family protein